MSETVHILADGSVHLPGEEPGTWIPAPTLRLVLTQPHGPYACDFAVYRAEDMTEVNDPPESWQDCYVDGFVKWDGCCEYTQHQTHICGPEYVDHLPKLLRTVYRYAGQFLARSPEIRLDFELPAEDECFPEVKASEG